MRLLIIDTETTGLPKTKLISPDTLELWPHIVQFSFIIYDTELNRIVGMYDYIIKMKQGCIIPEDSINIHGITNQDSAVRGVEIENVFDEFFYYLQTVDKLIGHNVPFDINMIRIELLRLINSNNNLSREELKICKQKLHYITSFSNISCTLQDSITLCNISAVDKFGKTYLKYPKLLELHKKLFDTEPNHLHNSLYDIIVTLRCFLKMKFDVDLLDFKDEKYDNIYDKIFKN
jgi:DNA polymerase III epsilon subunit-like protein